MDVGEHWAYGSSDTPSYFMHVKILRIEGNNVLVAVIDEDGVETWRKRVHARFLRCPWGDLYEFRREAQWRKSERDAEIDAAEWIFENFIGWEIAHVGRVHGDFSVAEGAMAAFQQCTGLDKEALERPTTDAYFVARAVAGAKGDQVIRRLEDEEQGEMRAALAELDASRDHLPHLSDTDRLQKAANEAGRLTRRRNAVLREWAGADALAVVAENRRLRVELLGLYSALEQVLPAISEELLARRTKRAAQLAGVLSALARHPRTD